MAYASAPDTAAQPGSISGGLPLDLSLVLDAVSDGVTVQDASGRLVYANAAVAKMCGYPSAEAMLDAPLGEPMGRLEIFDALGKRVPLTELPGRLALSEGVCAQRLLRSANR